MASKKNDIVKGTTESGFNFSIPRERLDNFFLVEALRDMENDKMKILDVIDYVMAEDKQKLIEHCAKDGGRVSMLQVEKEISDIFHAIGESGKKS